MTAIRSLACGPRNLFGLPALEERMMELIHCPGCACDLHDADHACPVCGVPRGLPIASVAPRNPFRLIALCVAYAVTFWLISMFALDALFGAAAGHPGQRFSGSLLLASIALSIALTVRGSLPGTAKAMR
jgi:hypothetical protein